MRQGRLYGRFLRFNLVALFVLIGFGGTVRALEAGMGCPDWPRCYGAWIPPTSSQGLPADYKSRYARLRAEKNKGLAIFFERIGAHRTAEALRTHTEALSEDATFSPLKAWIEYLNRLVGVLLGFGILLQALAAWRQRATAAKGQLHKALIALTIVVIQGLMGALVVQTHLFPFAISLHMLLTFALLFVLLRMQPAPNSPPLPPKLRALWVLIGVVFFAQILLGTQVRQIIEQHLTQLPRNQLMNTAKDLLIWHRSVAVLLIGLQIAFSYVLIKERRIPISLNLWATPTQPNTQALLMTLCMLVSSLIGLCLVYGALPPVAQVVHLWMPFVIFALWTHIGTAKKAKPQVIP